MDERKGVGVVIPFDPRAMASGADAERCEIFLQSYQIQLKIQIQRFNLNKRSIRVIIRNIMKLMMASALG